LIHTITHTHTHAIDPKLHYAQKAQYTWLNLLKSDYLTLFKFK